MFKKFYLNKDFFDFLIGNYYNIFADQYIHVISHRVKPQNYKKYDCYEVEFCTKFENEFITTFTCHVDVGHKFIQLYNLSYVLESDLVRANNVYFPLSPAWFLRSSNFSQFLRRCQISLTVYKNADFI